MLDRKLIAHLILCVLVLCLAACASAPPPQASSTKVSCTLPTFAPFPETKERQDRAGIVISLAPASYECRTEYNVSRKEATPTAGEFAQSLLAGPNAVLIEETRTPYMRTSPDRLAFEVTIVNQLSNVFRGLGAVPQFTVGGKLVQVPSGLYAELTNLLIPPQGQATFTLQGPELAGLADKTVLEVALYDIATKTDAASNVTERQNYRWVYNYATQIQEREARTETHRGWVRR